MMQSENIGELAKALSQCQAEMRFALKDSNNPYFKSKYADLTSIWEAIRDPMTKNGLSVTQVLGIQGDIQILTTMLMHASGQWIKSVMPIIYNQNTPQAYGSGTTYARRYSLAAIVGVVQDDDDGEAAMPKNRDNPNPNQVKIKTPAPVITPEQADYLKGLLARCDEKYRDKFMNGLAKIGGGLEKLSKDKFADTEKALLAKVKEAEDEDNPA